MKKINLNIETKIINSEVFKLHCDIIFEKPTIDNIIIQNHIKKELKKIIINEIDNYSYYKNL